MKTNEAPKKLYLSDIQRYFNDIDKTISTIKYADDDIEYIRTDAFIEKVCEFLKSYRQDTPDGIGYISGIINDKTIEDFKNYMKEE